MTCYKTGALIHIEQYGEFVRCDVHEVGNVYYFRINNNSRSRDEEIFDREPLFMTVIDFDNWWDKDQLKNSSTLIALKANCYQFEETKP